MTSENGVADPIEALYGVIEGRKGTDPSESYTARLFSRGRVKIANKVGEEAVELVSAALAQSPAEVVSESADLLYHLLVLWAEVGVRPSAVIAELERRQGTSGLTEKAARKRL